MPEEKNPYKAFNEEAARLEISSTKDVDDPAAALEQDEIDSNRTVPAMNPVWDHPEEAQPS